MKTNFTLLVATLSFLSLGTLGFSKAPPKPASSSPKAPIASTKPFRLISDKSKTCVYAPTAKTELEKRAVLIAGASEFGKTAKGNGPFELCLAFLANEDTGKAINTWSAPGVPEQTLEPGTVTWTAEATEPKVVIHPGYERDDADTYIQALVASLNGVACVGKKGAKTCKPNYKKALEVVHKEVGVKEHPLDWLLAP